MTEINATCAECLYKGEYVIGEETFYLCKKYADDVLAAKISEAAKYAGCKHKVTRRECVPVVHCKDCKYTSEFADGHKECRLLVDLKRAPLTYHIINDNDFCSYGERKQNT